MHKLPAHIAIIMDGNGRWARKRSLPRIMGHRRGVDAVRKIVKACGELGIKVLTLYTFSTENWKRPETEVSALMKILSGTIKKEIRSLIKNNVRFRIIGDTQALGKGLENSLKGCVEKTSKCTGLVLNVALNYGGRQEIINASRSIARKAVKGELAPEDVDEELFSSHLYTSGMPYPDLLIRTSGEFRVSNFLLFQIAYTEIWVTGVLWPDFNEEHLYSAIADFQSRDRRFGS